MNSNELEQQRPGENKETKINKAYIESGSYRRKFDEITDDKEINRLLYNLSKRMLYHRSGTLYEDMYWIDMNTKDVFAFVLNTKEEQSIYYSKSLKKKTKKHKYIITIHSHPSSCPPSLDDFNSNFIRNYYLGIVVCHDGRIYLYNSNEFINSDYFNIIIDKYLRLGYNIREAQILTIEQISVHFNISCKEV